MKILIVANEFPYPANHGGKVEILNRILAFKNAGHQIFFITWQGVKKGNIPNSDEIKFLEQIVDRLVVLDILRNLLRFLNLFRLPSLVAARLISKKKYAEILKETKLFIPDFIFVDGIYGALLGQDLRKDLNIPLTIRLHNIESIYMKGQLALIKTGFKVRISLLAACLHLKSYEEHVVSKSDLFFDISMEDLEYWKKKGNKHGLWLPTVFPNKEIYKNLSVGNIKYDLGFLGNLNTPNNVEGLKWFFNEVMPLVLIDYPELRIIILGSEPCSEIKEICNCYDRITLIASPSDPKIYLDSVNILINPVKFGSGVNIKSVEMLMRDNEVVTTSVGIKGMPAEISEVFFIADTSVQFSNSISDILIHKKSKNLAQRVRLRKIFQEESLAIVIDNVEHLIHNNSK